MKPLSTSNRGVRRNLGTLSTSVDKRTKFHEPQLNLDTVVFVHGFMRGHYTETWHHFTKLISGDPDLPKIDILLWGYPTGLFSGRDLDEECRRLVSDLKLLVHQEDKVLMVGHSMGGIMILSALREEAMQGRMEQHPSDKIQLISLFASPLNGKWAAWLARRTVFKWILSRQLRNLSREDYCERLLLDITERIYRPEEEGKNHRKIKIRTNVAMKDAVVSRYDSKASLSRFNNPPPHLIDQGHAGIKEPASRSDVRYLALMDDVQEELAKVFQIRSQRFVNCDDAQERVVLLNELYRRYYSICEIRSKFFFPRQKVEDIAPKLLKLAVMQSARTGQTPSECFNRAAIIMSSTD